MKDFGQQGVSGVVIIRGDSAHLPLAPPTSSDIIIQVNCGDYVTTFQHGCRDKPKATFTSGTSSCPPPPGLVIDPTLLLKKNQDECDKYKPCLRDNKEVDSYIRLNFQNNNNSLPESPIDNKTEIKPRPCLIKSKEEEKEKVPLSSSTLSVLDQGSRSSDPKPHHSTRRMTHSPGDRRLFGTSQDTPGQPPPFRLSASAQHQHREHQFIPGQAGGGASASIPPGSIESPMEYSHSSSSTSTPSSSTTTPPISTRPYPLNQSSSSICDAQHQALSSPSWSERPGGVSSNRTSFDHQHISSSSSHLVPPPRFEELQEFHGTSQLTSGGLTIRPRHYSGGEIAIEMQRKQQQQQQQHQQQLYQQTLQVQGHHGSAPLFHHGSAPFLSDPTFGEHKHLTDSDLVYSKHGGSMLSWTHMPSPIQQRQHLGHFAAFRNPSDSQLSTSSSHDDSSSVEASVPPYSSSSSAANSSRIVPTEPSSSVGSKPGHQALIASLPEIQMTEMVSEAEQAAPWMSHTPDNLSPTVQIVHRLAQATVSDNKGQESPLTTSSGNNSPRMSKTSKSVLHIPTPDISPSLSPTSCTKQKQRFIFPDVAVAPAIGKIPPTQLPPALTLESAGLNVSLTAIKSESHRWRHVSSGSSGDSSTAGEASLVPPSSSFVSPQNMNMSSSSSSGVTGSIGSQRLCSGDTDVDETLVDSETGSSVVEDSGSSREQSPFGLEQGPASAASPTLRRLSPSGRRVLHRQPVVVAADDDPDTLALASGEEEKLPIEDERLQPPKFKRRLHERYVSSLREDMPRPGEEISGSTSSDSAIETKPVLKLEAVELDSDFNESSLPKSPRRSVSDDIPRTDSYELSADEGDVFMEPIGVSQRLKPRNQQKPLDLSRSNQSTPTFPGAMHRTGSLPETDTASTPSPSMKSHYSPLYRSPHRMTFSPHGLMSPQSQSPLCSVPEGGRIFNFNMQPPFEGNAGAHSDTDIISPSPMSPRFFTFPSVVPSHSASQLLNPMAEVNRLAVSPRALYPTSPIQFSLKSKTVSHIKWENLSKRSYSDSDVAYQCPICGQVFPSNDNLAKHMAKHLPTETIRSSDNNKIHYCKVCDRSFSRSDMLTRHMRLHTGLKPYECIDCGQVFSRSDHLNTHKRTHTGEKPYRCPHCPYAACRRDMITRHMRTHTKRTPKRNRYLSVPDNTSSTEAQAGSVSSAETASTDSRNPSRSRVCSSLSSIDSLDLEIGPSGQGGATHRWLAQVSVESLPQTEDSGAPTHTSTSSHDSEDTEDLLSPGLWPRKAAVPSPLSHQEVGVSTPGHHQQHSSLDDDAFLAVEPVHHEKRPRDPSPHPRGHLFSRMHAPPTLLAPQGSGSSGSGAGGGMRHEETSSRFPKSSSSSSSSVSRESTS